MKPVYCELLAAANSPEITDAAFRKLVIKALSHRKPLESVTEAIKRLTIKAVLDSAVEMAERKIRLREASSI